MQTTLRVLKVFLASPSDVKPERETAEEIVNELNKSLSRALGWNIQLYMWEDAIPGYGRPQEVINPAVDECDLFIGLLWECWGQPTGKYSSGFEEEYERALARRESTEEPEIWLVFKAPNPEKVKDPGVELTKVIEFRKKQGSTRQIFYKELADSTEWRTKLQNWLWENVVKRTVTVLQTTQPQQPAVASELESTDTLTTEVEISEQLLETAASLTRIIKSGDLEFARSQANLLQEFDVVRLFLLSATWMSRRYTNDTIGAHEMNLLYKYREQLDLTTTEYSQVFRSVLADTSAVIPGWFWFRVITPDSVRNQLFTLSTRDPSSDVRMRTIQLLRDAKIILPKELWQELPVSDDERSVRAAAYDYLASFADESILPFLDQNVTAEEWEVSSQVRETRFSILLRCRPKEAFAELIATGQYIADETIKELEAHASVFDDEALLKGVENQWEQLRKFSANELAKRGHLSNTLAKKLTEDSSVAIRGLAFTELAKQGHPLDFEEVRKSLSKEKDSKPGWNTLAGLMGEDKPDNEADPDAVILTFFRYQKEESVLAVIDWFGINGVLAYKSLATDHYDAIKQDLRSDLECGFARIRQRSIEAVGLQLGTSYITLYVEKFKDLEDFVLSQFVEAALTGIAANGQPSDLRFGRQYLASDHSDTKLAAVRIVSRFGTPEDVPALLQISKEGWGEARNEAGLAALRLSPTPIQIALELTESNSPRLVRAGYEWLYKQSSPEVNEFFQTSMDSESDTKRVKGTLLFSQTSKPREPRKAAGSRTAKRNVLLQRRDLVRQTPTLAGATAGILYPRT